jgi:hypothetical protein
MIHGVGRDAERIAGKIAADPSHAARIAPSLERTA